VFLIEKICGYFISSVDAAIKTPRSYVFWLDNATEVIIKGNGYQKHCHIPSVLPKVQHFNTGDAHEHGITVSFAD
jgi:hypothetical protein